MADSMVVLGGLADYESCSRVLVRLLIGVRPSMLLVDPNAFYLHDEGGAPDRKQLLALEEGGAAVWWPVLGLSSHGLRDG